MSMSTPVVGGTTSEIVTLATSSLKTASPTDLLLEFQAECGLWADIANTGNSTSPADAQVKVSIELDGHLATRSANGFEWISLDVGRGVHTIEVKAQLTESVECVGRAQSAVGKRTLVVQPMKLANDATI